MLKAKTSTRKIMEALSNMLKEDGTYSLNRCTSVLFTLTFIIASIWLIATKYDWGNYDMFAAVTAGGGSGIPLANKFINNKYNARMNGQRRPPMPPPEEQDEEMNQSHPDNE